MRRITLEIVRFLSGKYLLDVRSEVLGWYVRCIVSLTAQNDGCPNILNFNVFYML